MPSLLDPIKLGAVSAPNRILMSPLTRGRATREHVPTDIMQTYYAQRASAGLIISEATGISRQGLGWPYAPGIWTDEQVEAWKPVTDAVHEADGRIFVQLWHMGRIVHPSFLDGEKPVSSSATVAPRYAHTYDGKQPYEEARALELWEIPELIDDYTRAAANAIAAGFDGVQIHAANGYLIDQFLRNGANLRDDDYGGSIENRVRLLRQVTQAVSDTIRPERTAVRISPNGDIQGVNDSDPEPLFAEVGAVLDEIGIAFLEVKEPPEDGTYGKPDRAPVAPTIRKAFNGPLILNSDYTPDRARSVVESGEADGIAFGRPFIANPDLVERIAAGTPLAKDDMPTWYSQGPEGYIDYPRAD